MSAPRQYTEEEVRDLFLKKAKHIALYWANESRVPDVLEKIEGEEEVEKMDALLSLAITGGDCNWI